MSRKAFEAIKSGLEDAIAYARGEKSQAIAHRVRVVDVDVSAVRREMGLSQSQFAAFFGVSPATIQNWEQRRRRPEGPARVLLTVIAREPEAVRRALLGGG